MPWKRCTASRWPRAIEATGWYPGALRAGDHHEDRSRCDRVVVHHEHQRGAAKTGECRDVEGVWVVQSLVGAANRTEQGKEGAGDG